MACVMVNPAASLLMSPIMVFKRVPIPKGASPKDASEVRPIDVYSVLMRTYAKAAVCQLVSWKPKVLHPGQLASKGGVLMACAKIAWCTECSLLGLYEFWWVSVDFSTL